MAQLRRCVVAVSAKGRRGKGVGEGGVDKGKGALKLGKLLPGGGNELPLLFIDWHSIGAGNANNTACQRLPFSPVQGLVFVNLLALFSFVSQFWSMFFH